MDVDGLPNLPNEIITDIFLFCLPQESFLHPNPRNAPILLTHVCSSWRAFATHVPALWRSIALSDATNLRKGRAASSDLILEEFLLEQVALWSANSRGHLAVSLDFRPALIPEDGQRQEQERKTSIRCIESPLFWDRVLRHAVIENSLRLQRLFLKFELAKQGNIIYDLTSECIPALETLCFTLSPRWGAPPSNPTVKHVTTFSKAPSLRRVLLDINSQFLEIHIPWAQLTHLALLQAKPTSRFHFVLQECHFLQTLSMKIKSDGKKPPHVVPSTIAATHLRELTIYIDLNEGMESFLAPIQFPVLNCLRFCWDLYSGPSPRTLDWTLPFNAGYNHFVDQLHLLRSLTLGFQNISSESLLEILRCTPLLVDLSVDSELSSYTEFLKNLTYRPETGKEIFIPKLENFSLYLEIMLQVDENGVNSGSNISFTSDAFLAMLISRSNISVQSENSHPQDLQQIRPARLKNVLLCVEEVEKELQLLDVEDLCFQLRELFALGLDVDVRVEVSNDKTNWLSDEGPTWC